MENTHVQDYTYYENVLLNTIKAVKDSRPLDEDAQRETVEALQELHVFIYCNANNNPELARKIQKTVNKAYSIVQKKPSKPISDTWLNRHVSTDTEAVGLTVYTYTNIIMFVLEYTLLCYEYND